jgi:hypothetical protein
MMAVYGINLHVLPMKQPKDMMVRPENLLLNH